MKSLQASMILRNEEEMLPRALDSLKGIDSVMICDTGSSDSSFEIYQQYKDKGYNLEWFKYSRFDTENHIKDFSHARNECKEKCTGDWLFILDGDEYCEFEISKVKEMINSGWMGPYDVIRITAQTTIEKTSQPRVFRNKADIWYWRAYHNTLMFWPDGRESNPMYFSESKCYRSSFNIIADYGPNHTKEPDRTLNILTEALKNNPYDTSAMYYIAREHLQRKREFEALFYLQFYTEIAQPNPETAEAWFLIATIYINLNIPQKAFEAALKSVMILPSYKKAWEIIHLVSTDMFKPYWKVMVDKADNEYVMFVR